MRTYLTRVASSAAVAAVAALALAGPANATPVPVPAKAHTTLSIVEFRNVIKAGQKDVVSGTLRSHGTGLAREVVLLDRLVGGKFVPWKVQLTNKAGRVAFTVSPGVTARYELVFRGTEKLAHTHSGIVTVKVIH